MPVADVVIVGAGASGSVAALHLARAGFSVVCLEQGRWHDASEYRGTSADWELVARKQWVSDPNVRANPADYPIDVSDSEMSPGMFNGVGGGTILYNAVWPRLTPGDFRVRSEDGVADDWPITYEELLPYYEATDRQFGVSGLGGNPIYPGEAEPPHPPLPIGRAGLLVARAHSRLGWHWWPDSNAILSVASGDRHPCVQRGTCAQGCNEGAKATTDITHWPSALAAGAQLITGATVTRVLTGPDGRATGAEWVDEDGRVQFQAAEVVLLAANGIGTPRLLLASAPDGLANSSGLVGRRLMLHPYAMATGLFDEPLGTWQGHNGSAIGSWQFYGTDPDRGFVRGSKWSLHPTGGPLRHAAPPGGVGVWGDAHHDHVAARLGRSVTWICICDDLPDENNRVTLTDRVDRAGVPIPAVTYHRPANSNANAAFQRQRAAESLVEAGAYRTMTAITNTNAHLLGTARMGDDPATSVVDRWGMCHDIPNLGIIDGSVFVTAGAVNPTSTISALALRAAEHLASHGPARRHSPAVTLRRPSGSPSAPPEPAAGVTGQLFAAVADWLIPGRDDRPWPSAVGVGGAGLDMVLSARPDLAEPLSLALALFDADAEPQAWMASLAPALTAAVGLAVAGAYYMDPSVRAAIGYPGQEARPVNALEFPEYVAEGLL